MLQDLRDQKNSGLIVVFFALIILAFVFMFGLPSTDCASKSQADAGYLGDHTITYEMLRSQILQHYDDNIFSSMAYTDTAKNMTQAIGVIYMLADDAREAGLRVSDEELQDYITNWESGNPDTIRYFLHKNKFSQQNYNNSLGRFYMSSREYEAYKREELLARRYLTLMQSSISVSDESLWLAFAEQNASADIEVIRLTADAVRATFKPLSDEEISAYQSENIQKYYDEHRGEFTTPAKAKLQQITIQKDLTKLTNPGAKTVKTQLTKDRAAIAMRQATAENADFNQVFADYDESDNKDTNGMTGLLSVEIMDDALQAALEGKKIGEIFQVELSNRIVIAKLVERVDEVVTPIADVKNQIAQKLLDDARVQTRTDETAAKVISMMSAGKSMADALKETLYQNVLAEQPVVAVAEENTEDSEKAESDTDSNDSAEETAPAVVAIPTDLPIVPEEMRAKAVMLNDIATNSGFIMGLGVSDELARDIRGAADNTVLTKAYKVGMDTVIVRVVAKKAASREAFNAQLQTLRDEAIAAKTIELIGYPEGIISLNTVNGVNSYGTWIREKIAEAEASGRLKYNNSYFERDRNARLKRQQQREAQEAE